MFGEMLEHLMESSDNKICKEICKLDHNERDDLISIKAEGERIIKQMRQLQSDQKIVMARRDIFWDKLKKAHKIVEIDHLQIDNESTTVYEMRDE